MGLGILDQDHLEHVPGTAFLTTNAPKERDTTAQLPQGTASLDNLKQSNGVVLVPQPSDSPNDPLNWKTWKKEAFMVTFAFAMGCVGCVGPLLSAAAVQMAVEWDTTIAAFVRNYNSVYLGGVAISSIVNIAFAVKYGKRPVFLVNSLLLAAGNFWGGGATSLASMAGSRFVAGWGVGCWQSLIPANIAEIWFVHQRGFRLAVFHLGLIGGLNLVLPISALILTKWGWRTVNYGMGAAFVLVAIMVVLFMPETTYFRSSPVASESQHVEINAQAEKGTMPEHDENFASSGATSPTSPGQLRHEVVPSRRAQYMFMTGIRYDEANIFMIMLRTFRMALSPCVAWGAVLYSTGIAWQVVLGVTVSQIFSAPPYNFTVIGVGLTKLAAFVASLLGAAIAHPLSDGVAVWMAKLNKGVYEPEFRLPLTASYIIFAALGFFVWGKSAEKDDPWPIPVIVGLGGVALGVQLTCTASTAYVIDCHRDHPLETFAFLSFLKCVFAVFLTLFVNDWIISEGVSNVFYTLGGVTTALTFTTIPMYIYGKRARAWYHRRFALRGNTVPDDPQPSEIVAKS